MSPATPIATSLRIPARHCLAALAVILAVLGGFWSVTPDPPLRSYDQPFYLGIAYDLHHAGRFTDGFVFSAPGADGRRPPGMRFAPLYPALLAAAASVDHGFAAAMDCEVESSGANLACGRSASLVRSVQFAMLVAFFMLVWWFGAVIGGSMLVAWLAMLLGLGTAPALLRLAAFTMTETTALLLATAAMAAPMAGLGRGAETGRRKIAWMFASGALLGLASLTRPAFMYLFYAAATAALAAVLARRLPPGRAAAFVAGFCLLVGPWMLRNWIVLGHLALTFGYASNTLTQRISFDAMSWREYGLSYLCWLPDGPGLGHALIGAHACDRFGWDERPDTFYSIGLGPLMRQTIAAAGGVSHQMTYLLHHYIFREPLKHALVTIPLALRGAWIDHYWGLVLGPICFFTTIRALRRRDRRFLLLAVPAWFMLLFNAAVAVNQDRYNLMLIPAYAVAGALLIAPRLARRSRPRAPDIGHVALGD